MIVKIKCPKCGRILGDTTSSLDAILNCPNCKQVHTRITFADGFAGYGDHTIAKLNKKGNGND